MGHYFHCFVSAYLSYWSVCVADRRVGMCTSTLLVCMRSSSPGCWSTGESGVPSTISPARDANRFAHVFISLYGELLLRDMTVCVCVRLFVCAFYNCIMREKTHTAQSIVYVQGEMILWSWNMYQVIYVCVCVWMCVCGCRCLCVQSWPTASTTQTACCTPAWVLRKAGMVQEFTPAATRRCSALTPLVCPRCVCKDTYWHHAFSNPQHRPYLSKINV